VTTGPPPPSDPDPDRAAVEHWRRVAEERSAAYEELSHRPLVRAVVGIERRARPVVARLRRRAERTAAVAEQAAVAAQAVAARPGAAAALAALRQRVAELPAPPVVAPGAVAELAIAAGAGGAQVAAVDRALRSSDAPVVVLVPAGVSLWPGAVERLAASLDAGGGRRDGVVAATPTLVHGDRPAARATAHDGRTLAAGLGVAVADGVPTVQALRAGTTVAVDGGPASVPLALAAGLALDRDAVVAAGGLAPLGDLDAAIVELLVRLGSLGGSLRHVPAAVAVDDRPVRSRRALHEPIDPAAAAWLGVVDRAGPALVRAARPAGAGPEGLRFVLTIAAPSGKVARRWGDLHLAEGLASSLVRQGHRARVQTFDHVDDPAGRASDVHVVVRGLRAVRRTPGQAHVLWIISHPEAVRDQELHDADLVLVASARLAAALAGRTATPVRTLLQATDHRRFSPGPVDPAHEHPVSIVAKSRDLPRPMVLAAVEAGLAPAIYGGGWERFVDPSLVVADHVDNEALPAVYRSAGVVLNDHWDTMRAGGFVSNRLFDVLACGTPVISDHLPEIGELLGDAVPTWRDPSELGALVRADLEDPGAARARAARGRATVLAQHTFDHRADELLQALADVGIETSG
jgi:glycosyltransferase involved in cell wall biosynthesis